MVQVLLPPYSEWQPAYDVGQWNLLLAVLGTIRNDQKVVELMDIAYCAAAVTSAHPRDV